MPKGSAIALAAVLALTIGAAPAAAAKPAPCKAGQLQVKQGKRSACTTVPPSTRTLAAAVRAVTPAPSVLRKRTPKRLCAKLPLRQATRLDAAIRKAAARSAPSWARAR